MLLTNDSAIISVNKCILTHTYIPEYTFQEKETSQEVCLTLYNRNLKKNKIKSFPLTQLCMFKNLS